LVPCGFSISHYVDITEVVKADSQVVVNTLTEHDFQDAFKKIVEALGTVHICRRGLL
jgi:predicted helicase